MKFLNGQYYVEVKDHRYRIYPPEIFILRERDPPNLIEYNIKFKVKLNLEKIKKIL